MNNQIQLVLKSSTTELPLNDKEYGIYLVPELDGLTGLPAIRTTSGVNSGYDGGWTSAQNYDARSITIRGVIANEDIATVERLRKQLTSLAGQGKSEELTLDLVTEAGNAYTLQVRTIALEMAMQRVLKQQEFMLQLRADDPLIYDSSETAHEALIQVSKATGGFLINFELPLAITGGSEEAVVTNDGLEQVPTITRMYGALHNPKIINHTTNQSMQIMADLGYSEGDWHTPSNPVEGEIVTLNNTPNNAPFDSINLKGNTEQQTYSGKNLFDYATGFKTSVSGLTNVLNDDGTITISGKPTANYVLISTFKDITDALVDGATYTLSSSLHNANFIAQIRRKRGDGTYAYLDTISGDKTFTIDKTTYVKYEINIMTTTMTNWGDATATYTSNFQLESGSSATSFEPYVGGTASPNPGYPQEVRTVTGNNDIKITGRNLIGGSLAQLKSWNTAGTWNGNSYTRAGIVYTPVFENGLLTKVIANGTSTANPSDFFLYRAPLSEFLVSFKQGVQYTISAFTKQHDYNGSGYIRVATANPWSNVLTNHLKVNSTTKTIDLRGTSYSNVYVHLGFDNGVAVNNLELYPQLVEGSTLGEYEPHQEQRYELCLNGLGKNIYNTKTESGEISSQYGTDSASTIHIRSGFIPVIPNTTYVLSATAGSTLQARAFFYDADKTYISPSTGGFTNLSTSFTTTTKTKYMRIAIKYSSGATINVSDVSNIQLELGSSATTYAAPFSLELCKIGTYQDYIYKDGDKWYKHEEIGKIAYADMEFYSGQIGSTGHYRMWSAALQGLIPTVPNNDTVANLMSNVYTTVSANTTYGRGTGISQNTNSFIIVYDPNYDSSSAASFISDMTAAGAVLYYPLASANDIEITNEAVISQLNTIADQSRTYAGMTNVCTIPSVANPQATTEVSYMTEKNPDNRDLIVIDSRLRTITLNGLDVYHLQADGSEFIMLAPGENRISLQSDITGDNGYAEVSYKQGYLSI